MVAQVFNLCQRVLSPAAAKNYLMVTTCDLCESLYRHPFSSKCRVGALACAWIEYGQPRAAILYETFAEVSTCYESSAELDDPKNVAGISDPEPGPSPALAIA
jgi:hypothetical protein